MLSSSVTFSPSMVPPERNAPTSSGSPSPPQEDTPQASVLPPDDTPSGDRVTDDNDTALGPMLTVLPYAGGLVLDSTSAPLNRAFTATPSVSALAW